MTPRQKLGLEKEEIIKAKTNGASIQTIADRYGCSYNTVKRALLDWGQEVGRRPRPDNSEIILKAHGEGMTAYAIIKELGLKDWDVRQTLRDHNIDISHLRRKRDVPLKNHAKEIIKRYEAGEGVTVIARDYNCFDASILKLLRKNGVQIRKLRHYAYEVNEHFFDKITSGEQAYILGFIFGDGCNMPQTGVVTISITDLDILEDIVRAIGWKGPIQVKPPRGKARLTQYKIAIGSRIMSDALLRLGCVRKKTYSLQFPGEDLVPKHLQADLLRGLLDSDGSIPYKNGKPCSAYVTGTNAICLGVQQVVFEHLGLTSSIHPIHVTEAHTTYNWTLIGRRKLRRFLDWLYKDSTIHLQRKYDRYLELCQDPSTLLPLRKRRPRPEHSPIPQGMVFGWPGLTN